MSWKQTILTVQEFTENRPDMEVHSATSIQSAIYQAAGILDSETNGLIGKVWDFNYLDPNFAPDSELKRNAWELSQIKEAVIVQTQYMLNMGNDLSVGGGSYSIGNINSSWSRPENRDIVAPGVYKLLQNGRVYKLQSYGISEKQDKDCSCCIENKYDNECLTQNRADKLYVKQDQGEQAAGGVAVVGENGIVNFANPNYLNFSNFSATRIKDWLDNDYRDIDKITNQLFRGNDLYGVHSGVQRGELYNLLAVAQMNWSPLFNYKKGQIWDFAFQNKNGDWYVQTYLALRDNVGKDPRTSPEEWQALGSVNTNLDLIAQIVYDRLIENNIIPNEVQKQLNELPTINYKSEAKGEIISFNSQEDFETYKTQYGIDDSYFENIDEDEIDITNNEIYAGYKLNGKKVYVKYIEKSFGFISGGETEMPIIENVDIVVNLSIYFVANNSPSSADFKTSTQIPFSSSNRYVYAKIINNNLNIIKKSSDDLLYHYRGVVYYTKKGE